MLAPPVGLQPLLRWAQGPLSVFSRSSTTAYKLQVRTRDMGCIHALPRVLQHQTMPLRLGGLQRYYMSHGSRPTSLVRWALAQPRVPRLRTSPRLRGELRCHRKSHGSRPRLSTQRATVLTCGPWVSTGCRP
jgi:hypothetical protein